jgi:hypothetical protein
MGNDVKMVARPKRKEAQRNPNLWHDSFTVFTVWSAVLTVNLLSHRDFFWLVSQVWLPDSVHFVHGKGVASLAAWSVHFVHGNRAIKRKTHCSASILH